MGLAWALGFAAPVGAATVASFSPQGDVGEVRQIAVRFDTAVVPFGAPRLPDPLAVACEGPAPAGAGRWVGDRTWVYDFAAALPPGVRCTVQARAGWTPQSGTLTGNTRFQFATGGPAVIATQPGEGATIAEDQHFLVQLNAPAVPASVTANARCEVEGLADAMPVRIVEGSARDDVLRARRLVKQADRWLLLACQRPFAPGARVRLVWGKGIASSANPKLASRVEQRFAFDVREPFSAEFSCERERANTPCLPIRPMTLRFSEPIARAQAQAVRLVPPQGAPIAPRFDPDDRATEVSQLRFPVPLAENTAYRIELPAGLRDASGRALSNAASFPLTVATGDAPPIAKFAAAPFGIVEWTADAALPLTLRHVQGDLRPAATGGQVRLLRVERDADMLAWVRKLRKYHETQLSAREIGLPQSQWTEVQTDTDGRGKRVERRVDRYLPTRTLPLLDGVAGVQRLDLPALQGSETRPFEVIGIPLTQPGYHVVEIVSRRLGQALLDAPQPMFVRTGVLVTNLGVHFKRGRENSLVWVTSLDRGKPVAGAQVALHGCQGEPLWSGRTDAQGRAPIPLALEEPRCGEGVDDAYFVTARQTDAKGVTDSAFVFSHWQQGIESWRFNHPTGRGPQPDAAAHTVFDRMLLRAGETVSMKHFLRWQTGSGLALPKPAELPTHAMLVHEGSEQSLRVPLVWAGSRSATSSWNIPPTARLGSYRVTLVGEEDDDDGARGLPAGRFRVEEFRVPLVDARLLPPRDAVIGNTGVQIGVQLSHLSGGGVGGAPLRASALLRDRVPAFAGFDDYVFAPPRAADRTAAQHDEEDTPSSQGTLVADKLPLTTDRNGAARIDLPALPPRAGAAQLEAEVSFADPNGEVQTVATRIPVWPAAVVPGIRSARWASERGALRFTAIALDTAGKPLAGQALEVRGRVSQTISSRKRLVGGFYAYDNRTEQRDLGALCSGSSDARGLLACTAQVDAAGEVELIVSAKDAAGRQAQAAASVWVTGRGELWFAQDDDDRIDVLPEKKHYEPGETARLQVRMPFREATALVAVEREGLLHTQVVTLRGDDPTVELPIDAAWGPNVYVSVLALRGRIRDVPWTSFFRWGWRHPLDWARAWWFEGKEYRPPTALVDLAKPAFKLGVAAIGVGVARHTLQVAVSADKPQYLVREKAVVRVRVTQGGKPLPAGEAPELAFAAVDEGLLALQPNTSWDLLAAMLRERAWGVETSTAQSEIVGRRHHGRKAVAAGGGGGQGGARELFDTLLLWKARVPVDANGEALVEVPLNDSLTSFRLVAVADAGADKFGHGSTSIRVTQELQLLAGLPPLVREGDRFAAMLTLRNTTGRDMAVRATLAGVARGGPGLERTALNFPPQDVRVAAGAAADLVWPVDVPADTDSIAWEAAADEQGSAGTSSARAKDRLKRTQLVSPTVPLQVLQATLVQLDGSLAMPVAAPAAALPASGVKRGGVQIGLQPRLSGALPGLRRWFAQYPFACLEQKASKAIGLRDATLWAAVAANLPGHLDSDGLANYFPPRAGDAPRGSDRLTAYLLAAADEAGFAWPPEARDAMLDGLAAFVEGRIERRFWSPRADLDVRKLAALEALSRHGRVQPRMLGSLNLTPALWPTAALLDWLRLLQRVPAIADRDARLAEAQQLLRSRLTLGGTTLRFSTEATDAWWWLMDSPDANANRLILAVLDDPAWRDDLPRLVVGALGRQRGGAWSTTTANVWGALALDKFSAAFESQPMAGRSMASLGGAQGSIDWASTPQGGNLRLPWPAAAAMLNVQQQGGGRPWLAVQSIAAVPLTAPMRAGYGVVRSLVPVEQKQPGRWSRGDIVRVRLEVDAQADMAWVVLSDPVPAGATVLGSGLGRDSALATRGERREGSAWVAFEERGFEAWRAYYEFMPRGRHVAEYTVRLNNPGRFGLPPTRIEAMYAPESFGEAPNAPIEVAP